MAMERRFRDITKYLIHRCWIIRGASGDEGVDHGDWGRPLVDASPVSVPAVCRIEHKAKTFRETSGTEVVANIRIFFARPSHATMGVEIGPQDKFVFDDPDDFDPSEMKYYRIVSRDRFDGWSWEEDPAAHWEIWVV